MQQLKSLACLLFACLPLLMGCSITRHTSTPRTPLEQALLGYAARRAILQLPAQTTPGASYFLDLTAFESLDQKFLEAELRERLLVSGLTEAAEDNADLIIRPRVVYHGVDESNFLIGIPKLPLPIPGVAAVELPAVILLGHDKRDGRTEVGVTITDAKTRALVTALPDLKGQSYYTTWTFLFVFGFSSTDLPEPFAL